MLIKKGRLAYGPATVVGQVAGGGGRKRKMVRQIFNGKAWKEFFKMKLLKVPGKPPITAEEAGMG